MQYGPFQKEREQLDWSFHKIPSRERQELQDEVIRGVLDKVGEKKMGEDRVEEMREWSTGGKNDDEVRSRRPLALFTAG